MFVKRTYVLCCAFLALTNAPTFVFCKKKKIIDSVKVCRRNDPNISECYADNFRRLIPLMKNGVPEMNLLKIEPLVVDKVSLDFTESRTFRLETQLINISLSGLADGTLDKAIIKIVPEGMKSNLFIKIPHVQLISKYKAKGNFLLISIDSHGDFAGNFSDLDVVGNWNSHKYIKKGKEYLAFKENDLDINVGHISIQFENLFGNNKELNDNINLSINENIDVLYEELKPIVLETIRAIILDAVNNVFTLFPFDTLFPV